MSRKTIILAGGITAVLILACIASLVVLSQRGLSGTDDSANSKSLWAPGVAPEPQVLEERAVEIPAMEPDSGGAYDTPSLAYAAEQLIIRNGNISMVVEDTRDTLATIKGMVASMASDGAFVVSSEEYGGTEGSQPQITLSIRVPVSRFDETMDRLAELAIEVTSRSQSSQDVTEEYVDAAARVESLEAARERLLDIMAEARTTKDLLEAEQQLTQREAEIESIKGRMQYLEQSARLSNIWIDLQPDILSQPVSEQWRPAETARRAIEALVDGLQGFGDLLIFFAIVILPWLAAIGLVIWLIVRLIRWRSRTRSTGRGADGEAPEQVENDL